MRALTLLVVSVVMVSIWTGVTALDAAAPPIPYPVMGKVMGNDNQPVSGARIYLRNETSGETGGPFYSDSEGDYLVDLASFPSGWQEGDVIRVSGMVSSRGQISYGAYTFTATWAEWSGGGHVENIQLLEGARLNFTAHRFGPCQ